MYLFTANVALVIAVVTGSFQQTSTLTLTLSSEQVAALDALVTQENSHPIPLEKFQVKDPSGNVVSPHKPATRESVLMDRIGLWLRPIVAEHRAKAQDEAYKKLTPAKCAQLARDLGVDVRVLACGAGI